MSEIVNQVICAAIRLPDGSIVRGHRHDNCLMVAAGIARLKGFRLMDAEQGFVRLLLEAARHEP